MDAAAKKTMLRRFPFGMYAVTVADGEDRNAFTANWLTQAAFEPPAIMVAVESDGHSIGIIRRTGVFTVNVYATGSANSPGNSAAPSSATRTNSTASPTTSARTAARSSTTRSAGSNAA